MGLTVTLTGQRHTDGTEGRVSLNPRVPWVASSGGSDIAPGPLYFKITASGTLETLQGGAATAVATYDSADNITFTPSGCAYLAKINIAGQEIFETWTIDGANATISWASLGIKPAPADRITYPNPLTTESPVRHYATAADLPGGSHEGSLAYIQDTDLYYGHDGTQWFRIT